MTVFRSATRSDACAIAELLVEAFSDEFRIVFGRHLDEARAAMAAEYRLRAEATGPGGGFGAEGTFVAEAHQEIVGVIMCCTTDTPRVPRIALARDLWRQIGPLAMGRAMMALALLNGRPVRDACYVDYLAVRPAWRRRGIGSRLIAQAQDYARSVGRTRLTLEVSSRNEGALRLYQQMKFTFVPQKGFRLTDRLFGMPRWLEMEKQVR